MKILKNIINVVLILIIDICVYKVYIKSTEYKKADKSYEQIRIEKQEESLYDKYEDYRGWIKINNTNIDYSIVQGKDNSFYLDKDINKNYLSSGSIFMNYLNNGFNDENTILFGHHMRNKTMFAQLEKYKEKEFFQNDNDIKIEVENDKDGALELARRSRGTPRLANRLLKRVRDFAQIKYDGRITKEVADYALNLLEVDKLGLDQTDRQILMTMIQKFGGGPVGLETLAVSIGEDPGTLEDVYEPYLVQNGLILRTPRGRVASDEAYYHFGIPKE